jgi:capsular polysaccharide export protein
MKGISSHPLVRIHHENLNSTIKCGWGYRPSGLRAKSSRGEYLLYEDAPVRSLKPGYSGGVYGITVDKKGAMFDASGESDLIDILQDGIEVDAATHQIMEKYRDFGISKYNWSIPADTSSFAEGVLLVDQSRGDASMKYGGGEISDFSRLFDDAIDENPESIVYIKTHPDRLFRKKKSCFSEEQLYHPRVRLLPAGLSPADCFQFCKKVYVGTSLMGMEALIHGCEVVTYGWNFYAGWGLTTDRGREPLPPRERQHSVINLFQACYIGYAHYYDPDSRVSCGLGEILDHIQIQKTQWAAFRGQFISYKANQWKRLLYNAYIKGPETDLKHVRSTRDIPHNSKVLLWGSQKAPELDASCSFIRVEDGFIRSNGLGARLTFPLSWVFDDVGIYFDARSPSRLEKLLNDSHYSRSQLAEATTLIKFLCTNKLTKYNLGLEEVAFPAEAAGKKVILVPGQVDSDASIKYGSPTLKNNKELLEEVRRQNPDAYICYKPHPDLLSGARPDKPLWAGIENQVDHLVEQGDIISWIEAVDEVHTLTSTVGFEALMRNKPVFTYGLPFYAGWGLTEDWLDCERRTATRTLEELVYAVLIEYPTYLNPKTGEYTTALNVAKLLADPYFSYDARPLFIKLLAPLKSIYNRCIKRRLSA